MLVAGRILLVLAAAAAVAIAGLLAHRANDVATRRTDAQYTCPMHPEALATYPSECPICRMALVPAKARLLVSEEDTASATRMTISRDIRAPAWLPDRGVVLSLLYRDEIALIEPEETAEFRPAVGPPVKVRFTGEPPAPSDSATSQVRWRVIGKANLLPGAIGWLELAPREGKARVVPYGAVLQGPQGPYLLVVSQGGLTLTPRPIETGRVFFGFTTVVSGLGEGERFVAKNAVLFDTERRLVADAARAAEAAP
jgi:multidrug efflux pump subunit AcrA (membrane-fusion protein)